MQQGNQSTNYFSIFFWTIVFRLILFWRLLHSFTQEDILCFHFWRILFLLFGLSGNTALHNAAMSNYVEAIKALIQLNADIHATDEEYQFFFNFLLNDSISFEFVLELDALLDSRVHNFFHFWRIVFTFLLFGLNGETPLAIYWGQFWYALVNSKTKYISFFTTTFKNPGKLFFVES